jgi:hypothetical protein
MGTIIAVVVAFAIIRQFIEAAKKMREAAGGGGDARRSPAGGGAGAGRHDPRADPTAAGAGRTQQEALGLEDVLREIERIRAGAPPKAGSVRKPIPKPKPVSRPLAPVKRKPLGGEGRVALPSAPDIEDRRSLEGPARVTNLEEGVVMRSARVSVDRDEIGRQVAERRIKEAEARDYELASADHSVFEQFVRKEAVDNTAVKGPTAQQLRDAVVWRVIIDLPVSLRDGEG